MKFNGIDSETLPKSSSFLVKIIHRMSTLLSKKTAAEFAAITAFNIVEWRVVSGLYAFGVSSQKTLVDYTGGDQAQTSRILADRRMKHIEDLSLAPQQRLHLIEVDGRTFLVHAGKGHAASFIAVDGEVSAARDTSSATPGAAPRRQAKASSKKSAAAAPAAKPKSAFAAAIAQARRNNPSVEFSK